MWNAIDSMRPNCNDLVITGRLVTWSVVIPAMTHGFTPTSRESSRDADSINGVDDDRTRLRELTIFLLNALTDMVKCFC